MTMELIDKSAVVAEIERRRDESWLGMYTKERGIIFDITDDILSFIDTLEVKEVNIAEMADDYYDALIKEADWMDEGTMGHCRLAYYNGCKDVLNKIQKGE